MQFHKILVKNLPHYNISSYNGGKEDQDTPIQWGEENWNMWSRKFLFKITVQGFRDILQEDQEIKSEDRDHNEEINMMLYSDLILSMEDSIFFSIVDMERSNDHPQGCFRTAFRKLKEKFESTSQSERCEIKLEYESMKMKINEDPDLFINTLEKISRRMNEDFNMNILDEDIITKVLNTLPREYEELVDSLQVQMDI